jgi:porphobilinogen synthase
MPTEVAPGAGAFPARRLRRLRRTPALRRLVAETRLDPSDFIAPLFVREGIDAPLPIATMPGIEQHTLESLAAEAKRLVALGVPGLTLFGVPERRDRLGSGASDPDGIVQRAIRVVRDAVGDELVVIPDLCLDEYTDHGHCGILDDRGAVENDRTLERYAEIAVAQAAAGADLVAPSGMMDGQVGAIRSALDQAGYADVGILAYSCKYASGLFGPFREAVRVEIAGGGDRRTYQQDPANLHESVLEAQLDVAEGADIVMVKPALSSLDVVAAVRRAVEVPVAAYQVSGEYSMIAFAAEHGAIDRRAVALESLGAIKRAGAGIILTYFAAEIADVLAGGHA